MPADANAPAFRELTRFEKLFNRAFGFFVGLGLGLRHNYLLEVRGRKSGRVYSTPINLLVVGLSWSGGERYLVAPRGRTQWVRNAEAAGEITLKKGSERRKFRLRPIPDSDKPEFLKLYLERFTPTVQRYFPIKAGSPVEAFRDLAPNYPVFELNPA
ncbi:MAG: nitroreductase/quinone reductase family protein [Candidatus Acidiferrales bacterium]